MGVSPMETRWVFSGFTNYRPTNKPMYIQLSNSDQRVKLCRLGFSFLKKQGWDKGWRLHSAGYAVLQYTMFGRIHTVYLHKCLAEQFLPKPETDQKLLVNFINRDKLDCRIQNLRWITMGDLRREQRSSAQYRGVSKDGKRYRAVLYDEGVRVYLGLYDTPEQAAQAYNEESLRRFGHTQGLNVLPK